MFKMSLSFSMLIGLGLSLSTPSEAKTPCSVNLMLNPSAKTGVQIFNAPNGKPILIVPPAEETFHMVHVVDLKKGWWKIDALGPDIGEKVSFDEAWVQIGNTESEHDDGEITSDKDGKPMLSTPVYAGPGYAKKTGGKMMLNVPVDLSGCKGPWLKFSQTRDGKTVAGWWAPEDQCPNSVTNCVNGDKGERTGVDDMGNR